MCLCIREERTRKMEETREVEIVVSLHTFALRCFLNSLANLEYSTFPFLDGGKSDRKNERYLRRTSRYLLPPSMRRIRYRFASNIPTFPLSLRHTVVSDNHGGGEEEGTRSRIVAISIGAKYRRSSCNFNLYRGGCFRGATKSWFLDITRHRGRGGTERIPSRTINYYTPRAVV